MITILGRQSSHYTRQVRMLAHELGVDYTLSPIHDLLGDDPQAYGGNPALKLPALQVGDTVVWGSGNAMRVLARQRPGDEARVAWPEQSTSTLAMNAHEVLAHAMAAQVDVVLHAFVAKRPPDAVSAKRRTSLINCLAWLDANLDAVHAELPADRIRCFDLGLFCLFEHLAFRNPIDTSAWRTLQVFSAAMARRDAALATPYRFDPPPGG
ncbi:glutathione S-transferase family protein [Arenimonas donghaensis]|uniref:GST N-terminal domain-containing protein n=1 Tax=Arenimonas donghaensis DSM 18148 = HO3-R19 TaxID=1121014 RepID=A0A087MK56_9GAMM|nr:glutathione S-transferase [Arenimonas donghaensis]KFL37259.1 hypothetical protein N788_10490 [Arenimonas donghaensis DSM 18148 = HO3-R19]